jgi:hypothetical protein
MVISTGITVENGPIEEAKRIPTDKEMRFISTKEARQLFGTGAEIIGGVTVRRCRSTLSVMPNVPLVVRE